MKPHISSKDCSSSPSHTSYTGCRLLQLLLGFVFAASCIALFFPTSYQQFNRHLHSPIFRYSGARFEPWRKPEQNLNVVGKPGTAISNGKQRAYSETLKTATTASIGKITSSQTESTSKYDSARTAVSTDTQPALKFENDSARHDFTLKTTGNSGARYSDMENHNYGNANSLLSISQQCVLVKPAFSIVNRPSSGYLAYHFNARMFCLHANVCLTRRGMTSPGSLYHSSPPSSTQCRRATPNLLSNDTSPENRPTPCKELHKYVHCANSWQSHQTIDCPTHLNKSCIPEVGTNEVDSDVTVVVPAFIKLTNIYHYAFVLAQVTQILSSLNPLVPRWRRDGKMVKSVALLYRGDTPNGYGVWQDELTKLVVQTRAKKLGLNVIIKSLYEDEFRSAYPIDKSYSKGRGASSRDFPMRSKNTPLCMKNAVFMGYRLSNAWPFSSATVIANHNYFGNHTQVSSVPAEAIVLRSAVYSGLGLPTALSTDAILRSDLLSPPEELLLDFPPKVLGYARRNRDSQKDPPTGGYIVGNSRRFSDADEQWLMEMLETVAVEKGLSPVHVLEPDGKLVRTQVEMYKNVGIIVGIHGANLVNSMFMHPFGTLVEVGNDNAVCYIRGMNSGLSYWLLKPSILPSAEQSWCGPRQKKCRRNVRNRRIMLGEPLDRQRLHRMVGEAVERSLRIRNAFEHIGGVPVRYEQNLTEYHIDWTRARLDRRR